MADDEEAHVKACREWQRTKADAGWAGLTWPVEYGGRGLSGLHQGIFLEEEAHYDVPTGMFAQSIGMMGPTVIAHGTDEQKRQFLQPILRGEQVWCQLFSEPNAGSDLAVAAHPRRSATATSTSSTARRCGPPRPTSPTGACCSPAPTGTPPSTRASPSSPSTCARPASRCARSARPPAPSEFNEVFLEEVRVPAANVIGPENGGWGVAMTTLTSERADIGSSHNDTFPSDPRAGPPLRRDTDPVIRQKLARLYTSYEISRWTGYRTRTAASRGVAPGPGGLGRQDRRLGPARLPGRPGRGDRGRGRDALGRRRPRRRLLAVDGVRRASGWPASAAAPRTCSATSSPSGCSGCPATRPTTAPCRSATCPTDLPRPAGPAAAGNARAGRSRCARA